MDRGQVTLESGERREAAAPVEHPLRRVLSEELHIRPYEALAAPLRVSHLAMVSGEAGAAADHAHVAALCARLGAPPPAPNAFHLSLELDAFRVRWERHAEFSTYTVLKPGGFDAPFAAAALEVMPADWLAGLPGERLVALHLALEPRDCPPRGAEAFAALFGTDNLAGSRVAGAAAEVWSDFRLGPDGFSRILVRDLGLRPRQAGRLVQRLLEIETYRMMALLAFPLAREVAPEITAIDSALVALAGGIGRLEDFEDERQLLHRLAELSTRIESLAASTSGRFGAARAYYGLVERRIRELREGRIEGLQTVEEFVERRLQPAMRTCESIAARLETAAGRLSRAGSLLLTRVDLELQGQNLELLQSMNRRARLALRMQQAVEGLSVVAISYYLMGLVGYLARALEHLRVPLDPEIVQAASLLPIIVLVALGIRHVRKVLRRAEGGRP